MVLFEELVEQHRVHGLVAHGIDFSLGIASHQIGVDLFYLFGHEPELRDAFGIKLFLVAEGDRLEREDRFACFVHGLDLILEPRRGWGNAKLAAAGYTNRYPSHCYPADSGDKCGGLSSLRPDAGGVRLACIT